jgi:hypothetical protein
MNTGSGGDLAIRTEMHQDAQKGMKRPLKLAAFGSGLAAETTLSNRDLEGIAQLRQAACFSYQSHLLSEPCPPRRRSNVAALDILSINSTVIEGRVIFSAVAPAVFFLAYDESAWIAVKPSARAGGELFHSLEFENTHHEKT